MSAFPRLRSGAVMQYPARRRMEFRTEVMRFVDGSEQRLREWPAGARKWIIDLSLLDEDETAQLRSFVESAKGRFGVFTFHDPWDNQEYANCSLEADSLTVGSQEAGRGEASLVVCQNGE